ncbi:MAG: hypothetical protein HWE30_19265 [Methylocystaceae bacterium]|nr:hypothetical protein [Methylocystaceae bacterium]
MDWNVFQDLIQNRRGERLKESIEFAKQSGYRIVYSIAHMWDLSRCGNTEYVKKDLSEVSKLTDNWCVSTKSVGGPIVYEQCIPKDVIRNVNKQQIQGEKAKVESPYSFPSYMVDMSKVSDENILVPYLKKQNGMMSPKLLNDFVKELYEKVSTDYKIQKKFRKSLEEIIGINNPAFVPLHDMAFYRHIFSTEEVIVKNLPEIINSVLSLDNETLDTIPIEKKITTTYSLLDFFPAFNEGLDKRNNMRNIVIDALHVFLASDSRCLVSSDKNMLKKAKIVYKTYGVRTKVYETGKFIQNITLH